MSQVIRIPPGTFSRLEQFATGFDTPAHVIERLLDHCENCDTAPIVEQRQEQSHAGVREASALERSFNKRDITKYSFNNHTYGKGRLVLAVVQDYVNSNPETSFDELQTIFPKNLQGPMGVFYELTQAQEIYERTGHKRHYLNRNEIVQLTDMKVAVCTQWGAGNIDNFVDEAQSLGYEVTQAAS